MFSTWCRHSSRPEISEHPTRSSSTACQRAPRPVVGSTSTDPSSRRRGSIAAIRKDGRAMDALEQPTSTSARRRRVLGPNIRRRPSGEAPPLPRELGRTGKFWLFMAVSLIATLIGVVLFDPLQHFFERWEAAILRWFASWRSQQVIDIMTLVALLTSRWVIRSLRWVTIAALIVVKRWRHLLVFIGACFFEGALSYLLAQWLARP